MSSKLLTKASKVSNIRSASLIARNYSNSNLKPLNQRILTELEQYPSVITIPVQWGLQDSFQHLNNVHWLRFVESGRIDYMSMLGLHMSKEQTDDLLKGKKIGFIVKSQEIKYRLPVTYPDALTIATQVKHLEKDRFAFYTKCYSHAQDKLAGECVVVSVGYDYDKLTKSNLSEHMVDAILKLEREPIKAQEKAKNLTCRIYSNL
ncbi:Thioesterase/thiol ester dehydrase-isomerase [Conidiobolus coronatus NRRL 28638]|uniref:Thioesterase/thiol ester dehydrase-isomerase n=1 Tax=Conidiobolus coronatus (strain ATCC 28846 / CBS 209.66 / NRRL 28638) TaxID=796925 RepID=A0A137PA78_CONC2|nr:Thioesterase/thiol ester dehydrase-isomerase [Conidiobolus coronatus NRRL 28638]|eukprot:KXN71907.1 Thioesterase/thiol ester dehydrase-isomerase [Conidiobolus coronatus NRRL 28638]